jgi:uncharacterized protein (DUF3084 family)
MSNLAEIVELNAKQNAIKTAKHNTRRRIKRAKTNAKRAREQRKLDTLNDRILVLKTRHNELVRSTQPCSKGQLLTDLVSLLTDQSGVANTTTNDITVPERPRLDQPIPTKLTHVIAECHKATAERAKTSTERDNAIAERDKTSIERDNTIAERDTAIGERDKAIAERDTAIGVRDQALDERDRALGERNKAITDRDFSQQQQHRGKC